MCAVYGRCIMVHDGASSRHHYLHYFREKVTKRGHSGCTQHINYVINFCFCERVIDIIVAHDE